MQPILIAIIGIIIELIGVYSVSKNDISSSEGRSDGLLGFCVKHKLFLFYSIIRIPIELSFFIIKNAILYGPLFSLYYVIFAYWEYIQDLICEIIVYGITCFILMLILALVILPVGVLYITMYVASAADWIDKAEEQLTYGRRHFKWPFTAKIGFFLIAAGAFIQLFVAYAA